MKQKKTIVISAVNILEAGPLTILKECLSYLSELAQLGQYRVVAIVYDESLASYPGIEYIQTKWPKKRWVNRLWYEYVSMYNISKQLGPIYLWFSLHDTSPRVKAERRVVYCHNTYLFYKWGIIDLVFAPKIAAFALFTRWIYRPNLHKNRFLVVQQGWFADALARLYSFSKDSIVVAAPESNLSHVNKGQMPEKYPADGKYTFIFAASANSHKNFQVICRAVEILEKRYSLDNFRVLLTLKGDENSYARWIYKSWRHLACIDFLGFLPQDELHRYYHVSNCLLFPSKIESWGLPISEFASLGKPMLLADLPYARSTAQGSKSTAFFNPDDALELAGMMKSLIDGDLSGLKTVPEDMVSSSSVKSWQELFDILLTR